jgi:hypothetical protein
MDLARAPRRTARKKGSGYENEGPGQRLNIYLIFALATWRKPKPELQKSCSLPEVNVIKMLTLHLFLQGVNSKNFLKEMFY